MRLPVGAGNDGGSNHLKALLVREHGDVFHDGDDSQAANTFQGLFYQVLVAEGEGIGVHYYDAGAASGRNGRMAGSGGTEAGAVVIKASAVFKEDGFGGLAKDVETKAFKNRPVLRLGEYFEVAAASHDT